MDNNKIQPTSDSEHYSRPTRKVLQAKLTYIEWVHSIMTGDPVGKEIVAKDIMQTRAELDTRHSPIKYLAVMLATIILLIMYLVHTYSDAQLLRKEEARNWRLEASSLVQRYIDSNPPSEIDYDSFFVYNILSNCTQETKRGAALVERMWENTPPSFCIRCITEEASFHKKYGSRVLVPSDLNSPGIPS